MFAIYKINVTFLKTFIQYLRLCIQSSGTSIFTRKHTLNNILIRDKCRQILSTSVMNVFKVIHIVLFFLSALVV